MSLASFPVPRMLEEVQPPTASHPYPLVAVFPFLCYASEKLFYCLVT